MHNMLILAERLIAYLKTQTSLVSLLDDNNSIFITNAPVTKSKYVVVSTVVGESENSAPISEGRIVVDCVVSRDIANAHSICIAIAKKVDDLINKAEHLTSDSTYQILNFVRQDSTGLQIDEKTNEYYFSLEYSFLLAES